MSQPDLFRRVLTSGPFDGPHSVGLVRDASGLVEVANWPMFLAAALVVYGQKAEAAPLDVDLGRYARELAPKADPVRAVFAAFADLIAYRVIPGDLIGDRVFDDVFQINIT